MDYGAREYHPQDDYPDFVVPLARAVAQARWTGVSPSAAAAWGPRWPPTRCRGVRAALITDPYSAHQGVEDDDMNIMCLGGRVTCYALAWDLIQTFLKARYKRRSVSSAAWTRWPPWNGSKTVGGQASRPPFPGNQGVGA